MTDLKVAKQIILNKKHSFIKKNKISKISGDIIIDDIFLIFKKYRMVYFE
jgi:hypothetical protein